MFQPLQLRYRQFYNSLLERKYLICLGLIHLIIFLKRLICQKIVQKKSTADISGFPFVCGFLSITLWLRYGFLIQDHSLILVNTVGSTLHLAYIVTFYVYSIKKVFIEYNYFNFLNLIMFQSVILRQFLGCLLILAVSITYSIYERDREICAKYIGFLCCLTTIVFFAAPLTSLVHVVRVKSADSLPFPIIFMTFVVSVQWFVYGLLLNDSYIQVNMFISNYY